MRNKFLDIIAEEHKHGYCVWLVKFGYYKDYENCEIMSVKIVETNKTKEELDYRYFKNTQLLEDLEIPY